MEIQFDETFLKSIKKVNDKSLKKRLFDLIQTFKSAKNLSEVPNIKKMQGFQRSYRVRLGEYRVGFELLDNNAVRLIILAHRKEIYQYFP